MSSPVTHRAVTRWLVLATLVVLGLFGSLVDRVFVATPAWEHLGVRDWAAYSRNADLGNGLVLYPIIGILPAVLAVGAAITHRLDRASPPSAGPPIYLTALAMIGVLATTLKAAPIMLGIGDLGDDQAAQQQAFDQFTLWGVYVRGGFFAVAFLTAVWAHTALASTRAHHIAYLTRR